MVRRTGGDGVVADEELLPFRPASLDAVASNLALHWVNDLPGALLQIRQALKPDGLFLGALLGGETLKELRQCLMEAELAATGGASPRVSPFADSRDAGALLQRAGFALPVTDTDTVTVQYASPLKLMRDLRGMGAANAVAGRLLKPTRRAVMLEALRLYREKFAGAEGRVPATFQVVYMIGWAPHESQQQPLKPGAFTHKLADALRTQELPAGEKAG
jgi:SAM-dependent methyltransferase